MVYFAAPPITLMQLWRLHRRECRAIGTIVSEARAGRLAGVVANPSGHGFAVVDRRAALTAMTKGAS